MSCYISLGHKITGTGRRAGGGATPPCLDDGAMLDLSVVQVGGHETDQ